MTRNPEWDDILERMDDTGLWRPIELVRDLLEKRTPEEAEDHLARALLRLDVAGKSVADLGSNIGYHAFFVALRGAAEVEAYDFGEDIVRIGRLFAQEFDMDQVRFEQVDFSHVTPHRRFDMVLMLDIMGNNKIRKGRVRPLIDAMLAWTRDEAVTNVRPVYDIRKQLGVEPEALLTHYPGAFIRDGRFHMLEYVKSVYSADWSISEISTENEAAEADKPVLHFCCRP